MNPFFEAILNGWWQGIVLTLLVWLVMRDLPRISAATRLAIWQVTLVIVLLLPGLQRIPLPSWQRNPHVQQPSAAVTTLPVTAAPERPRPRPVIELPEDDGLGFLLAASIVLALVQLLRLAIGYWAVRRLKRKGLPAGVEMPVLLSRSVDVLISERIGMPMAVGYLRPAILLPRTLIDRLTPEEMRHVLVHESAHLLRNDDWTALAERLIRAIFFFQPAVYWIGRQIEREREIACDDWVVAQSGDAKLYATSLARVAELGSSGPVPLLATGAGRRKEIFRRLETLLDRTRNRVPAVSESLVMLAALIILLAVFQGARFNHMFGLSNYSDQWVETDGTHRREIRMRGDIRFTANDQDVESMSPGAKLVVHQSDGWRARTIEFEADERGGIERRYFSNGIARPFDAEAQRFVAKVLPQWVREQGLNIPERLSRLIEEKGPGGALEEIRSIRRNDVKRAYLEELFTQADLTTGQLGRALKIAGEMESDGDKRRFLDSVHGVYFEHGLDGQVFSFIDTIHSDEDRRQLLTRALDRAAFGEQSLSRLLRSVSLLSSDNAKADLLQKTAQVSRERLSGAFFDAASTIRSDNDRERLLSMVLAVHGSDPGTLVQVMRTAASISSDNDKTKILIASARGFRGDPETIRETSRVLASIHSDGDRRRCLEALIEADGANAETLREVLLQTMTMNSDGDKGQVLLQAALTFPQEEPVRRAFFSAVNTIHSAGDQRRVLMAVLERSSLDPETLRELSRSALQMSSDGDQSAVLKAISERRRDEDVPQPR